MLTGKREPVNILNIHGFYVAGSGRSITWISLSNRATSLLWSFLANLDFIIGRIHGGSPSQRFRSVGYLILKKIPRLFKDCEIPSEVWWVSFGRIATKNAQLLIGQVATSHLSAIQSLRTIPSIETFERDKYH
jgi:hypothetical protein